MHLMEIVGDYSSNIMCDTISNFNQVESYYQEPKVEIKARRVLSKSVSSSFLRALRALMSAHYESQHGKFLPGIDLVSQIILECFQGVIHIMSSQTLTHAIAFLFSFNAIQILTVIQYKKSNIVLHCWNLAAVLPNSTICILGNFRIFQIAVAIFQAVFFLTIFSHKRYILARYIN